MPPGPPDSPSLCAVTGERGTLMLDAGASSAHARRFLAGLDELGLPHPRLIALTHWHWDHIFGAAEIGAPIIACTRTARELARMALYTWTDAALDARVASGEEVAFCAENIKLELPEPRDIRVALADIVYDESLSIDMGGVRCRLLRVGGDHSPDSVVIYVEPDGVLFLGDCLYDNVYAASRHMTTGELFPLLEQLQQFDVKWAVEGHGGDVHSVEGFTRITTRMRLIGRLSDEHDGDPAAVTTALAQITGVPLDDDDHAFVRAFANAPRLRRVS
jgi:glyoxylase-like metal-dependent hydrolase (beta-lactamase superfamily II)